MCSSDLVDDERIYKEYMDLSLHGQTKDALDKTKAGSWEYDIVSPAYKCNMTDIQAAMGLAQLMRYQSMLKRRHDIISRYDDAFKNENMSVLEHAGENYRSSGHLYFIRPTGISEDARNDMIKKLAGKGSPAMFTISRYLCLRLIKIWDLISKITRIHTTITEMR